MNRLAKTILVFSILFFLVYFLPEVLHLGGWWDLAVQAPFIALSAMVFYKVIASEGADVSGKRMLVLQAFMVLSFFIFFEGHGMHWTANSIEVLIAENIPFIYLASFVFPLSNVPAQLYFWTIYPKIYYLDEMLGHQLVYTGFFLLLVSGMVLEIWTGEHEPLEKVDYAAIIVAAGIISFLMVQAVIEGQFVPQSIVLSVLILIVFPLAMRGRVSMKESPFVLFVIISVILLLAGILLYGLMTDPLYAAFVGPWPQPSEAKRLLNQFLVFNYWNELKWLLLLL
ncbi:MAG: hypothetical protein ACTSP1_06240 [Candidatus Freyarchaeota archaeon]